MADLRTGDMRRDCRGVPWSSVRDVKHCPACRGALPADVPSACSACGPTARGRGDGAPIYPQAVERERLARAGRQPDRLAATPGLGWGSSDVGAAWTVTSGSSVDFAPLAPAGEQWAWTDVAGLVREAEPPVLMVRPGQATFTTTGGLHYPPPAPHYTAWVQMPDGSRRQLTGQSRRRWWMFWRKRG